MQSAIKFAAFGLIAASFSKLGVQGLGVGHDEDAMGYLDDDIALRVAEVTTSSVSGLTTADFSGISTFPAIDPSLLIPSYMKRDSPMTTESAVVETSVSEPIDSTALITKTTDSIISGTTTISVIATETVSAETSTSDGSVATETSWTTDSIWTDKMTFTSVWESVITHTRGAGGVATPSTTCTSSSEEVINSTSAVDGISGIPQPSTLTWAWPTASGTLTGFSSAPTPNGTWTAPTATSTFQAGAMGMKMVGANIIGAAVVAVAANLL